MKNVFVGLALSCLLVSAGMVTNVKADEPLSLWVHPYLPAMEITRRFTPFTAYLASKIGRQVQVRVSKDYESHIARVGEDKVDLAYMGPVPYVKMVRQYGPKRLLACLMIKGTPHFHGMIIARRDSAINDLGELAGKSFAFGDPNSTMSHLVPLYLLKEAGVELEVLRKHEFLGSHDNVALAVIGKYYDAGGVKEEVYYKYKDRGLKLLATSPPIQEHLFVAGAHLSQDTVDRLSLAMQQLEDQEVLGKIKDGLSGLAAVSDHEYNPLRLILKKLGMANN